MRYGRGAQKCRFEQMVRDDISRTEFVHPLWTYPSMHYRTEKQHISKEQPVIYWNNPLSTDLQGNVTFPPYLYKSRNELSRTPFVSIASFQT